MDRFLSRWPVAGPVDVGDVYRECEEAECRPNEKRLPRWKRRDVDDPSKLLFKILLHISLRIGPTIRQGGNASA